MLQDDQKTPLSEAIRKFGRNRPQGYRILVEGRLDPEWSNRLGGLRIQPVSESGSNRLISVMEGIIADQSQLSGVLNTLHDLRLSLLGVELIEAAQTFAGNRE